MTDASIAAQARAADLAEARQARAMTEEQRISSGPRLFAGGCDRIAEGLQDENPTDEEPNASLPFTVELFELSPGEHDQLRFSRRRKLTPLVRDAYLLAEAKAEAAPAWDDVP